MCRPLTAVQERGLKQVIVLTGIKQLTVQSQLDRAECEVCLWCLPQGGDPLWESQVFCTCCGTEELWGPGKPCLDLDFVSSHHGRNSGQIPRVPRSKLHWLQSCPQHRFADRRTGLLGVVFGLLLDLGSWMQQVFPNPTVSLCCGIKGNRNRGRMSAFSLKDQMQMPKNSTEKFRRLNSEPMALTEQMLTF